MEKFRLGAREGEKWVGIFEIWEEKYRPMGYGEGFGMVYAKEEGNERDVDETGCDCGDVEGRVE